MDKSLDIQFNRRYIYNPNMETEVFEYEEYDAAVKILKFRHIAALIAEFGTFFMFGKCSLILLSRSISLKGQTLYLMH
jgi:hypothetical protein